MQVWNVLPDPPFPEEVQKILDLPPFLSQERILLDKDSWR
jgi:hypothetical protein